MRSIIVTLSIFFVWVSSTYSQNATITGKITAPDGTPIFSVNVVTDRQEGTVTDPEGKYTLEIKPGPTTVTYSYIGYKEISQSINLAPNEVKELSFHLESLVEEISTIVIGASKRGKALEKEIVSIDIIKPDMLEKNNITSASDAMELVPGVSILDGQASIRGGSGYAYGTGSRVIAVLDEIPILTPERNEIPWIFIPTENVEQMEVLKGAASVQYGSSALNGILNVRTKWPTEKKQTSLTFYHKAFGRPSIPEANWWANDNSLSFKEIPHETGIYGTHMRKLGEHSDLVVGGLLHSSQTHLKGGYNHRGRAIVKWRMLPKKVEGLEFGLRANSTYRNRSFFFIWNGDSANMYQPLDGATYQDLFVRTMIDPYVHYYDKKGNVYKFNNRIYHDRRISSTGRALSLYQDFQYQRNIKNRFYITGGFSNWLYAVREPSLRKLFSDSDGSFKIDNWATYVQAEYTYKDLSVNAGARADWYTIASITSVGKPVFNGGISYGFLNNNFVRAYVGQSFRIPSLAERYVDEDIGPVRVIPNPDIQPESGYSIEIGYKRKIVFPESKWVGYFDATVFWNDYKDMVEFSFGQWENPIDGMYYIGFKSINISEARILGWETTLSGDGKIGNIPFSLLVGYTYNYPADASENPDLKSFGKILQNSFKAFKISDEEHQEFADNYVENTRTYTGPKGNPLYGMLKYRFRHLVKADISATYKKFTFGTNVKYYSYMDRVDGIFEFFIPDIKGYRDSKKFKGDVIWNLRTSMQVVDQFSITFIAENVLNRDYQIRPAKPNAPRTFTFQGQLTF